MNSFLTGFLRLGMLTAVCFGAAYTQTPEQNARLLQISAQSSQVWKQQRAEAESLAQLLGIPVRQVRPDGGVIELQRFDHGLPMYFRTLNLNAAKTVSTNKVWPGGTGGFSLTGSTDTLAVWDEARVRPTHQEFGGRVILSDDATTNSNHSTHVGGTMIAAGVVANAKGMSYQGTLKSYDWNNDLAEMSAAAAARLRVSNHSYGFIAGWYYDGVRWQWYGNTGVSPTEDYKYGFYTSDEATIDNIALNAPYYLIVKAAGNDRLYGPSSQPVSHGHAGSGTYTDVHDLAGAPSGYDCIGDYAVAKDVLTVGAVYQIPNGYTQPSDVVMSSFSGWGPVDDGRIKPDVVGKGVGTYSSIATSNTSYATYDGTSMASPSISGSLGLLLQLRKAIAGDNPMRSSTLKGLVIHTADEAGTSPGPDYVFGWGLMNTLKAAQVMRTDSMAGMNKNIRELTLSQGQIIDIPVNSDGLQPLRATICWTDPPGTPPPPSLDPPTPMLVNDLDLRIVKGGSTYYPWVLNPASPSSPATTGDNTRDNVEQVHIASPTAGQYTVRISHKGILYGGSQQVSVIITGGTFGSPLANITVTSPNGGERWYVTSTYNIQWASANVGGNVRIDLSTDGGATFAPIIGLTPNDGVEPWLVSSGASTAARIRVASLDSVNAVDTSAANFVIIRPTLTLSYPAGGEVWPVGASRTILWSSANLTGNVRIDLSRDGGLTWPETLFNSIPNTGSQAWTVNGPPAPAVRMRISSVLVPSVADTTDASFAIAQPAVSIIQPNGGETWRIGAVSAIRWSSQLVTGNVRILLSRNGGATFPDTLFSSTPNDTEKTWTVTGPPTTQARIRIISLSGPAEDTSDADFVIVQPTLTLISPNGGESWRADSTVLIRWSSSNLLSNVTATLSRNGGVTFPETLFANTADDGSEPWLVTGPAASTARVRIAGQDIPALCDTSDAGFAIEVPSITVQWPAGGDTLFIDSAYTILWTSASHSGNVNVELSRDGGASYEMLAANTPDDGSEPWIPQPPGTIHGRIRVSSVLYPSVIGVSSGEFMIGSTVLMPVMEGWNMLSLGLTVPDTRRAAVFPASTSQAFAFGAEGYVPRDTLEYGVGYWLKFGVPAMLELLGGVRTRDTIAVVNGWNLIGSISYSVPVDSIVQIPPGLVTSSFYGHGPSGYAEAGAIQPMQAYWVKANQSGHLVLSRPAAVRTTQPVKRPVTGKNAK